MPGGLPGPAGAAVFVGIKFAGYFLAGRVLTKYVPAVQSSALKIATVRTALGVLLGPPVRPRLVVDDRACSLAGILGGLRLSLVRGFGGHSYSNLGLCPFCALETLGLSSWASVVSCGSLCSVVVSAGFAWICGGKSRSGPAYDLLTVRTY